MKDSTILNDLKQLLLERYGDNIKQIILFGSRAINKAHKFSDYDILIILNDDYDWKLEKEIIALCYDIDLKYDIVTDIKIISRNELMTIKGKQQFILEAMETGVSL